MCKIYISHFEEPQKNKYQVEHQAGLDLLSHALSDSFGISMTTKELTEDIEKESNGKPFLKSYKNICYNISHSKNMVACAISNSPVGVDLEEIQSFLPSILRRTLTSEEKSFLEQMSVDDASQQEWFFRFWTLKESYIKHSGIGLAKPLTDFSFTFDLEKNPYGISCSEDGVYFSQYKLQEDYILSLCTSVPVTEVSILYV